MRKHHFAIVDEVDSVLIDEARVPLIISAPQMDSAMRGAVVPASTAVVELLDVFNGFRKNLMGVPGACLFRTYH